MSRYLAALITVAALLSTSSAAIAKPTIAVLGLEVISESEGALDETATQVAKDLTSALRRRAALGRGKYQLAPNSQKDLLELKLLSDCADENRDCMSAIGRELGAQRLLYGRIERQASGYQISLKLLNVTTRTMERTTSDIFTAAILKDGTDELGRRLYNQLTGGPETGGLNIVTNAAGGTVFIDGRPRTSLSAGRAAVEDLNEGRHTLVIEADGHERYVGAITVIPGETQDVSVRLTASATPPADDRRPGGISRVMFWSTLTIAGASGAAFAITGLQVQGKLEEDKDAALMKLGNEDKIWFGENADACREAEAMHRENPKDNLKLVIDTCEKGRSRALLANIFLGTSVTAALAASYFFYKGYVATSRTRRDELSRQPRRSRKRQARLDLSPSLAPGVIGADLRIEF